MNEPKNYRAIMLSSTFTDLKEHRQRVIEAISKLGYVPKVMEHSGARADTDVIDSSLNMVRDSAAYIGVISLKYGQTPLDPDRNPDRLSLTELEFNEAMRLGRPIVLFIMGDHHPVKKADVEISPGRRKKLAAFREHAKRMRHDNEVERVYEVFESLEQFSTAGAIAIGQLIRHLEQSPARPAKANEGRSPRKAFSNIPINVPLHFLGREDELAAIEAALKRNQGRVAITALHGLRGVGKTTLAAAFAERHCDDYRATWWIRAETESTMRADLVGLAVRLGWVVADEKEQPALVIAMEQLRYEDAGVLLIYDNAVSPDELRRYLPRGSATHIIVTSNAPYWGAIAAGVEIEVWSKEVGADYLILRTGRDGERDAALALSEALGGLPLAHEQAAAYCERIGISLADYRTKLENAPEKLLDAKKDASLEYHNRTTVAKTFTLAIDEAAKRHPAAETLIVYAALLAPEPIPLFLFSEAREKFGEPFASALADDGLDEAVAALRAFALVDRESIADERDPVITTDCIRLHRLVRQVAILRLETEATEKVRSELIRVLAALYPDNVWRDPQTWPRVRRLESVVLDLVGEDFLSEESQERVADLLNAAGEYRRYALGADAQARPFYERALNIREKIFGPEHPVTARSLNNLALLLRDQGDFARARELQERDLAISEKTLGLEHPDTAASLDNLAQLLQVQNDLTGARSLCERALAIYEKVLGPEHPETATTLNNLARLLQRQSDFAGARPLYERALAIYEKVLGSEHPSTNCTLNNLASLFLKTGKITEALTLSQTALTAHDKLLGSTTL